MSNTRIDNELEGVAIIGMEGSFPGAKNVGEFWSNLRDGVESVSFFTEEELMAAGIDHARLSAPNYVRAKGFLEDGDMFDASFFGYSPREAEMMDPQHRVFIECVWQALESAGYDPEKFQGSIGLYAGASINTYLLFNLLSHGGLIESVGNLQASIQNRTDHLTTRVAYELNLKGPAVTVQTACSTSLVAVHLACQSLLNGECDMALAGGVTVSVPLKNGYSYQEGGIMSPDGHCRAFDAGANGTVDGNGVGVVVLKRLEDALADGDTLLAVIRGSAINNDGSHKIGFTAPGVTGQAEVIAEAHAVAGVNAETITYVEAHGTGTTLGDPIEFSALTQAFRASTDKKQFCAIGSAKINVGHLDAAAGVTGLIKAVLALKHKQLPPSLHFTEPNPNIEFGDSPFFVNTELRQWEQGDTPRRAGVSSFGIGGTNAHLVLEEPPLTAPADLKGDVQVLALSARTRAALDAATFNLGTFLREHPEIPLADVAHTLHVGRRAFDYRRVVICHSGEAAVGSMETLDHHTVFTGLQEPRPRPVVMMFPGQGAQYVGMGRKLYETQEVFRREVDECAQLLRPELGFDLREVIFADGESAQAEAAERLRQTAITQPALFVIEYALAKQWMEWGAQPESMVGHSIGEYVAACLAGVFSPEDALRLVAARGRLMQSLPEGSMLAVHLPEGEVAALLEGGELSLAAINAPSLCVVSGATEQIDKLEKDLSERGTACRRLHTSHAFHSGMVEPILAQFVEELSKVSLNAPQIPFISNVTGTWITAEEATDPNYWVRHLRQPVLFNAGMGELFSDGKRIMLEVGPGRTLSTLTRHHPFKGATRLVLQSLRHADETGGDDEWMLRALGRLWLAGNEVNWEKLYVGERRRRVALPTYPFERQRYWVEARHGANASDGQDERVALSKNANLAEWFYVPSWKRSAPLMFDTATLRSERRQWLLFADDCGLAGQLTTRLEEAGQDVFVVESGEKFAATGRQTYTVNAGEREDYAALLKELHATAKGPLTIIHLWNVTRAEESEEDANYFERAQQRGFDSLLALAQGLGDANISAPVHLSVVTNGMMEVTGGEELSPEKALVLGACRVIPQELENVTCLCVDVTLAAADGPERERLVAQLIAESVVKESEPVVAYRGQHRWTQTFVSVRLEATESPATRLRERGVYLITGGLGGMALEFAEYLARTVHARLALVTRTPLPERARWTEYLAAHAEQDASGRKIRRIQALEALGSEVLLLTADVTDEGQVRAALADARRRFGEINGVIHTAGVPGGGIIQLKTRAAAAAVLAPKVMGTRLLDRALGDADLDFFALCSSRSSILGGFGQIDYSAANAFLDAFAHYNTMRRGTFTVSIDWDAWQGVGMLVDAAAQYGVGKETPQHVISQTGHPLLDRQIAETDGQEIYVTEVSPSTHWVLDDHRIVGAAIMPGTAYLEMARAALEKHPRKNAVVEIRAAFFLAPLGMRDDETSEVRTVLEKDGDDFEYRILSKPPSGGGAVAEWQQYSIGRIGYVEAGERRRFDIDAIRERCSRREVVITDELEIDPDLGPRWQSLRQVFIGDNELLAALELPVEFEPDFRQFRLHPALLDRATGTAKHYLTTGGHYLPMSYKRLRIKGDLPRKIYTYIKYRDDLSDSKETITFDIIVMDEHGVECIDIEGFSQKRVNDTAEPLRTLGQTKSHNVEHADIAQNGDGGYRKSLDEGITPPEGVDAFRRILAARLAPQVIVSTKDLQASIRRARALTQSRVAGEVEKLEVSRPAHARPDMASAYAAPRNETEATLCEILQTMLGIQQIGINDNFFDLGGDSVLGIQIIAKANRAGIQLTPQQIFQHQTVAEMALAAGRTQASKAEQGIVTGPVPLTPAQHRLFEREHTAPERRGRATLLEMRETIDAAMMEKAVASIYEHHDALRLRFTRGDDGWRQENAGLEESAPFSQFDISMLDGAAQQSAIGKTADELEARLGLTEGPLALFASFHLGEGKPDRLLIIVHDLAFDDASWQVLLEDLEMAYRQLSSHKAVSLPPKTTSFKHWAERLVTRAESESVKSELGFWLNLDAGATSRLPANELGGANLEGSARSILIKLGDEDTQSLIRELPQAYNARVTDVLLTALARAVSRQTGSRSLLLEMEVNGREAMLEGVSPSRTIGSLTECFPVSLSLEENSGPVESLSSIKEQLRAVPNWGLDFGLLCYLAGDAETKARLRALPSPEIFFRYLSKPAKVPADSTLFTGASGARGGLGRGDATRGHFVEVEAVETGGELFITLNYSENMHPRETIEQLAEDFLTELRALIAHRVSPGTVGFTPSDFPLAGLDEDKLSKLSSLIEDSDEDEEAGAAIAEVEEALRQNPDVSEAVVVAQGGGADEGLVAYVTLDGAQGNGSKRAKALDFSLFYFADADAGDNADKYRLYLEGAKFADSHGFSAVWTPERHFHENGGLYPSPSVLSAALATITENVRLRAGSVVLPLHNPIKVAEEWAIIDNLSKGRVDISITSGWIPNDFAFFPERFANKREEMFRLLEEVRTLWQGRTIKTRDGAGNMVDLKVYPKPVQQELPIWLTCSGDPQMFIKAGEMGVNVLTALLTQSIEETAAKIALYREARAKHGHDPDAGHVTLMMHTFVGDNLEDVVGKVRGPLCEYLKSHVGLVKTMVKSLDLSVDINNEELLDYLVEFAFERYYQTASLIGTPEKCLQIIGRLKEIGVDEVACFIDFGVDAETVLDGLRHLDALKNMSDRASGPRAQSRTHGPQFTSDSLRRFAAERLPAHMVPMDVVVLDALPRTQDGEIDRASLPMPTVAHAE